MKKYIAIAIIPLLIACSSDEEELIQRQQQQIQQLQYQLQTSGLQEATPAHDQYQQPQYQQPPVVVQEHNDNGLLGGVAGFMLGQAIGNSNNSGSTHTERHYITNNTTTTNPANRIRDTPAPRLPTTIRQAPTVKTAPPISKPSLWSSKPSISSSPSRPFSSRSSSFKPSIRRR